MTVAEVTAVLRDYGWNLERQESSHMTFARHGQPILTIPCKGGRKVKGVYIARIAELLMSEIEDEA